MAMDTTEGRAREERMTAMVKASLLMIRHI
jgi:hypothetical protein